MKILGVKKQMSQIFDDKGVVHPVTIVLAAPGDLAVGDTVAVSGLSKGKGFQGVVKRHGFHGGSRTHGQKHSEREPGAIGGGGGRAGGRVAKGIRMAGRMGGERVTVRNLKVVAIDKAANQILVSGAVPGRRGTRLELKKLKAKS